MPEEMFERIMKEAPIYPSSDKALELLRDYLNKNNLSVDDWQQVHVTRPTKLQMERLPIGHSFCLTYDQYDKIGSRRFFNLMDYWRRNKDGKIKFAIIKHKSLFVYEIARLW